MQGGDILLALASRFQISETSHMNHTPILAVHCGASRVACGRFSGGPGNLGLEWFATTSVGSGDSTEDDWLAAVDAGFRDLVRGEKPHGQCVLGLPGHLTFNHVFRVPAVTAWQRRKIVAFEQRQGMSAAVEKMVWSHALVAEDENGREMMLAVAKRRLIGDLAARIRAAGWYPKAALPAWLVLRHAIGCQSVPAGGVLVLSVGTRSSQLVSAGARGQFVRTLAVGGATITQKAAEELRIDHGAAEALKLQGFEGTAGRPAGEHERAAGQRAVDQFVRRLCAEIQRLPPLLPTPDAADRPSVLWLTGGGARLPGLPAALAERLQLRVERWDLRSNLSLGRGADGLGLEPDDTSLADLVGLAVYATRGARQEGNLLPRSFRWEMFAGRRWPWLVAAALVVVVACLAPICRMQKILEEVRWQTIEEESALSVLRRVDVRNRSNLSCLATANLRIAALGKLARARSGWTILLGDLQERLASVQDVWLDRMQVLQPEATESSVAPALGTTRSIVSPPAGVAGRPKTADRPRLLVEGRLLDESKLAAGAGADASPKAESLLAVLRASPLVVAVERDRFVGSQPGILCFEITLRLAPDALF
jgi:type IV pilus assembly protein PilM